MSYLSPADYLPHDAPMMLLERVLRSVTARQGGLLQRHGERARRAGAVSQRRWRPAGLVCARD